MSGLLQNHSGGCIWGRLEGNEKEIIYDAESLESNWVALLEVPPAHPV